MRLLFIALSIFMSNISTVTPTILTVLPHPPRSFHHYPKQTPPLPNVPTLQITFYRYGPWVLLCKTRSASFPVTTTASTDGPVGSTTIEEEKAREDHGAFRQNWEAYSEERTVESVGLSDGASLMFEYGLFRKDEKL